MARYLFTANLGCEESEKSEFIEIDDELLDTMSSDGRQEYIEEFLEEWANSKLTMRWEKQ